MRKSPLLAITLVAALSLAACSSSGGGSSSSSSASGSANERVVEIENQKVTLDGEPGAAPIVRFDKPLTVSKSAVYPVSKGTGGEKLADGQLLGVNYVYVSAEDGTDQYSSWAEDRPEGLILSSQTIPEELYNAFKDGNTFAQVIMTVPASSTGQAAALAYYEVESAQTIPNRAEGKEVKTPATAPQVKVDKDGKPSVTMPKGDPPKELQAYTTIEGTGAYVDSGDSIAVNYTGWLWDGKQFDSSWDRGSPFTLTLGAGQVIPGWDEGLKKQKVGSQVLLVIPPDKGYGDQDQGEIPAGSTLVFVVDILGKV